MFIKVIPDAVMIGVISFATSISVADLYAKKHKYKINSNKVSVSIKSNFLLVYFLFKHVLLLKKRNYLP